MARKEKFVLSEIVAAKAFHERRYYFHENYMRVSELWDFCRCRNSTIASGVLPYYVYENYVYLDSFSLLISGLALMIWLHAIFKTSRLGGSSVIAIRPAA